MKYRNIKTGAVIDSPCAISGDNWVAEETPKVVTKSITKQPLIVEEKPKPTKKRR